MTAIVGVMFNDDDDDTAFRQRHSTHLSKLGHWTASLSATAAVIGLVIKPAVLLVPLIVVVVAK